LSDNQVVRPRQEVFKLLVQQLANVRDAGQKEVAIAAIDLIELDMRIEDAQLPALTEQMLEQKHHRAFPEIVRVFLESQAENTDSLRTRLQNHLQTELA